MRIVIELNKSTDGEKTLQELFKHTPLETTFSMALLALVNGEPRLLTLKQYLRVYLEHRLEVARRRSEYDLRKAKERLHILSGLMAALGDIDEVIRIIRTSEDVDKARTRLMKRLKLDNEQAQAILDLALKRLANLERKKIEQEFRALTQQIKDLSLLLKSPRKMRDVVKDELLVMKKKYGDKRRTQIVQLGKGQKKSDVVSVQTLLPSQDVYVGVTSDGLISRTANEDLPRISGRNAPSLVIKTRLNHILYLVATNGQTSTIAVNNLREVKDFSEGLALHKASSLREDMQVVAAFSIPSNPAELNDRFILTITRDGMAKKSTLSDLPGLSAQLFTLSKVNEGDELFQALVCSDTDEALIVTKCGLAIRFSTQEVRPMGLIAAGGGAIKLGENDRVVGAEVLNNTSEFLLASSDGLGWRLAADAYSLQGRNGQGMVACKLNVKSSLVGVLCGKKNQAGLILFNKAAAKQVRIDAIPVGKRTHIGKQLLAVKSGDTVTGLLPIHDGLVVWSEPVGAQKKMKSR
jgi:DNA gyrase subunit A